jgi:hypothetical protein
MVGEDSGKDASSSVSSSTLSELPDVSRDIVPEIPLWQFYLYKYVQMFVLRFIMCEQLAKGS